MTKLIKAGDQVEILAVKLYNKREVKSKYGSAWETAIQYGTVVEKLKRSVKVRLDCGKMVEIGTRSVTKSVTTLSEPVESSNTENRCPNTLPGPEESESEASSVSSGFSSDSDSSDGEEADIVEGHSFQNASNDSLLRPHGLEWKPVAEVSQDINVPTRFKAKLLWGALSYGVKSELDYFMQMYPHEHIEQTLAATNKNLKKNRKLTIKEWFQFLGILIAMSFVGGLPRDTLWAEPGEKLISYNFGRWMSRNRFETILAAFSFTVDADGEEDDANGTEDETSDKTKTRRTFESIQSVVNAFNKQRNSGFEPGTHLCVDESVSEWRGKDAKHMDGCPHVTKIIRKPKGVGEEITDLCDVETGIMLRLELVENKSIMRQKKYHARYGSGTGYLLRLTEDFRGSGRAVNADSAFASVNGCVALQKQHGLHFAGIVKTAHSKFPKDYLLEAPVQERGDHIVALAQEEGVKMLAVGWADKKRKCLVSTYGNTLPGNPHMKRRWKAAGNREETYYKEVKRPKIIEDYFNAACKIDVHNHLRQGSLSIETALRTHRWDIRLYSTILGIVVVDSYLAYSHFEKFGKRNHASLRSFQEELITAILANDLGSSPSTVSSSSDSRELSADLIIHSLRPLNKSKYGKTRKRKHESKNSAKKFAGNRLRCHVCSKPSHYYCSTCSSDTSSSSKGLVVICGPKSGRSCFEKHQMRSN